MGVTELVELQVATLFTHDPDGRIRATNEPEPRAAPRFFLGRTATGKVWRVRHDVPAVVARSLAELAASEPPSTDPEQPAVHLEAYRELLGAPHSACEVDAGPTFSFPPEVASPTDVVTIDATNAELLLPFGFSPNELRIGLSDGHPFRAIVLDGVARSMCHCARFSDRAAEAGVTTLPAFRGRGHARAVVAAWALAVRAIGRTPLYSTSWDNLASRAVARQLGLIAYGALLTIA